MSELHGIDGGIPRLLIVSVIIFVFLVTDCRIFPILMSDVLSGLVSIAATHVVALSRSTASMFSV